MTLLSGILTLLITFCLPETYVPLLIHRKAMKLREETGDMRYYAKFSEDKGSAWKNITVSFCLYLAGYLAILTFAYHIHRSYCRVTADLNATFQNFFPRAYLDTLDDLVRDLFVTCLDLHDASN